SLDAICGLFTTIAIHRPISAAASNGWRPAFSRARWSELTKMPAIVPDQEPQIPQPSALASFGDELRREREIRGISLKEIADATKISKRFLDAIERND